MTIDDLLSMVDGGRCAVEASRLTREVLRVNGEVADEYGVATGELTIKLKFRTVKQGLQTEVSYSIVGKPAEAPTQKTVLYLAEGNRLTGKDPRQQEMFTREAPMVRVTVREPKKDGGN